MVQGYQAVISYTLKHTNPDLGKNMLLLKNQQFLPNHRETLTKFRDDWVKIVDFLKKAYFCLSPD